MQQPYWILDVAYEFGGSTIELLPKQIIGLDFQAQMRLAQPSTRRGQNGFRDHMKDISTGSLHQKADPGINWGRLSGAGSVR
jgi:hypothetical protein